MSRIGNKPIPIPSGVKVQLKDGTVDVQGPKGKMNVRLRGGISFEQKDATLFAKRETEDHRALHGLARALVANAVTGVTAGFKKDLDIVGVGYRAELKGKVVNFSLGYSHPVEFPVPEGIQITVEKKTHLTVSGFDRGRVGQVSADIRALRPPDPYKQKGIRITGERLKKKAGKAGAAKTGAQRPPNKERELVATQPVRKLSRNAHRQRIHLRVRTRVTGTPERPRLCVYRSNGHIYAQVVDDRSGRTLVSASSLDADTRKELKGGNNIAAAKVIGKKIAE